MDPSADAAARPTQPGWSEVGIALAVYLIGIGLLAIWYSQIPDSQTLLRINVAGAMNGVAGLAAIGAACVFRLRDLSAFGFVAAPRRWMQIAAGLGVVAFGLCFLIEGVYFHFVDEPNTQADFQAAAQAGAGSLLVLLVTGAILTPLGEEFVFRGVVANALSRYGFLAGVVGSAAIFGLAHGFSVILLDAFMVGLLTGYLFDETRSVWPGVLLHIVYNGLNLIYYSTV